MPNASSDPRKRRAVTSPNGWVDFFIFVQVFPNEYIARLKISMNSENGVIPHDDPTIIGPYSTSNQCDMKKPQFAHTKHT